VWSKGKEKGKEIRGRKTTGRFRDGARVNGERGERNLLWPPSREGEKEKESKQGPVPPSYQDLPITTDPKREKKKRGITGIFFNTPRGGGGGEDSPRAPLSVPSGEEKKGGGCDFLDFDGRRGGG